MGNFPRRFLTLNWPNKSSQDCGARLRATPADCVHGDEHPPEPDPSHPTVNTGGKMSKICVMELLGAPRVRSFEFVREEEACNFVGYMSVVIVLFAFQSKPEDLRFLK